MWLFWNQGVFFEIPRVILKEFILPRREDFLHQGTNPLNSHLLHHNALLSSWLCETLRGNLLLQKSWKKMQSIASSCILRVFHFIFRSRRGELLACTRLRAKGMKHQQLETPRQGKCGILWFVFLFFFCWCCLFQRWRGSCSLGITAGTSAQLNHGLGHGFGGPFFFPCSNTIVGGFFSPWLSAESIWKEKGRKLR